MGRKKMILDDSHDGKFVYTKKNISRVAAELGRRGGKKSRRTLTPDQAKRMVKAREKKKLDRKVPR